MFGFGLKNKLIHWKASRNIGRNNSFVSKGFLKNCSFEFDCSESTVKIGENCSVENLRFYIRGHNNHITIENNVTIKGGVLWVQDNNSIIHISANTTIEGAHIAVTEDNQSINIGKDCMLSHGISIRNGDSHSIIDLHTNKKINSARPIVINSHVWIGANVTILKGVTIGENSIIGTGSIVTKEIEKNCIYTGIPAKKIKQNVNWSR